MDAVKTFNNELQSVYENKPPISRAKMASITKGAIKAIKLYKHVVQSVEKFIAKCRPEYKVPGLYIIDSIVRQSRHQFGIDKDVFAQRFSKNVVQTFQNLCKCPEPERCKIVRVLNLWQKNNVFSPAVIQPLLDLAADPQNPEVFNKDESTEVITSREEQLDIVRRYHEGTEADKCSSSISHCNRSKTIAQIKKQFFWPRISQDVRRIIKSCTICRQKSKKTLKRPRADSVGDDDCIVIKETTTRQLRPKRPKKCHILHDEDIRQIRRPRYWLSDVAINAAQTLFRQTYPDVEGLEDTCLSDTYQFSEHKGEFLQVYNANGNHWVTITNIDCRPGIVKVYDSFFRCLHPDTKHIIASLVCSPVDTDSIIVEMPQCQQQPNCSDCGLYALAFASTILRGQDPSITTYDHAKLRRHLSDCLQQKQMQDFPTTNKTRRLLDGKCILISLSCPCRSPNSRLMKLCQKCSTQCHKRCLSKNQLCKNCQSSAETEVLQSGS